MLHVEREIVVNNDPFYDNVSRFDDYTEAKLFFDSITPADGERWLLEYSSEYDARILESKGTILVYTDA